MSDRFKGCLVSFDRDVTAEEAQELINAIGCLRGVTAVTTSVATPDDWMNRMRIQREIGQKLWEVLYPKETP